MSWRYTAFQQFLCDVLSRHGTSPQRIGMGMNLEEVDVHGQIPPFWAATKGKVAETEFRLSGLEVNFRNHNNKPTALVLAIDKRAACSWPITSSSRQPQFRWV